MALKVTTTVRGDTVEVMSAGSKPGEIATVLLDAADSPGQVRTVTTTTGMGWSVPASVAKKAGIIQSPSGNKPSRKSSRKST